MGRRNIRPTNLCYSPIFLRVVADHQARRIRRLYTASLFAMEHQISSGLSLGVFDTEYRYKRVEYSATCGALYRNLLARAKLLSNFSCKWTFH